MHKFFNARFVVVLGAIAVGAVVFAGRDSAQARLNYRTAFKKKYKNLAAQVAKVKCGVCHHGTKKQNNAKPRNDYGKALEKGLGKKKVKAKTAIEAALTKTETAKNAKGQTFGSLIKAGKLPGTNP